MIISPTWAGKRYAVLGLARSGSATVRALLTAGASVAAWDSDPARREGHCGVTLVDLDTVDLASFDALVVSPGVPLNTHPLAAKARAAGVPIIGDIELFAQARAGLPPHKVVGITGTNGKSTVTALIHHILRTAGVTSLMGGNIGLPILAQEPLPEGGVYVLELSSYQLDLTQSLDCDVAVLTNITPDHLDRYDGFEQYRASKVRLFEMQEAGHSAYVSMDDPVACDVGDRLISEGRRAYHQTFEDLWSFDENVELSADVRARGKSWPSLTGPHNAQNAIAASNVARVFGVSEDVIERALTTFTGLPHRMERVATLDGVTYVDDSKATNPESAAPAIAAYPRVHWIVGGRAKGDDLDACAPHYGHVRRAYTIGEAGPRFAAVLREHMAVEEAGTLDAAVASAAAHAQAGETVLLSPACASFDQFTDYAARGLAFRRAVEALLVKAGAA